MIQRLFASSWIVCTEGVGDKVTQDMLILAGRDDHMIMPSLFCEEFDLLPNVRSLALQIYSNMDDAGSHCNMGNMKLALDTMIRWMDQMDDKNGTGIAAGKPGKRENLNLGNKAGEY